MRPRAGFLSWRCTSRVQHFLVGKNSQCQQQPGQPPQASHHIQRRFFTPQQQQDITSRSVQVYRSTSADPFVNLSIEHHLLQRSHPDSTVLFLYTNRPCVVIGRNQNPWVEVNLGLLRQGVPGLKSGEVINRPVDLVRRRSGGGTVFHDEGNVNWTVICPPAVFDRDRHAEMVVRALRHLGVATARVNERHDIVLHVDAGDARETYKISGSAYKLTRLRSLHHGTCLLASPNLSRISPLLRSPAEPYIKARGVESVRTKVRNVEVDTAAFSDAVVNEFQRMYGSDHVDPEEGVMVGEESALDMPEICKGVEELRSPEWIYSQTPQFTFSTHPSEDDPRPRPSPPPELPPNFQFNLTARHGEIQDAAISGLTYLDDVDSASQNQVLSQALVSQHLHRITDWREALGSASPVPVDSEPVGRWLNGIFLPLMSLSEPAQQDGLKVASTTEGRHHQKGQDIHSWRRIC
ncbi:hypothetical protein B0T17DRAFT_481550 [Bombardia bombarda]|uniref:Putative lipoate-protein ligase A n=1 Tax=Bombardia bombarda TaxID=252184 RepID=A0AA40CD27_9PEZI|nr:hypothetical protein B0T17DRAFT_481550 [Bombardia bombarda]